MFEGVKDIIKVSPSKALSVSAGFWIVSYLMIYLPDHLQYMKDAGRQILVWGAIGFLIPAFMGLPDWNNERIEKKKRKETIINLSVHAKDFLWLILTKNRRTIEAVTGNKELEDHSIIGIYTMYPPTYIITNPYWPLLRTKGEKLLYKGKHQPSNKWDITKVS